MNNINPEGVSAKAQNSIYILHIYTCSKTFGLKETKSLL